MSAQPIPTECQASRIPLDWKDIDAVELWESGVYQEAGLIRIPYRTADGHTHNERVISRRGRRWWARSGLPIIPFGLERLPKLPLPDPAAVELVICEGESDTMTVRGLAERDGRRVYAIGVPGSSTWGATRSAQVARHFPIVYAAGDGDHAGARFNEAVSIDIPWVRRVPIPSGEDVRSVVAHGGIDALADLMDEADQAEYILAAFREASTIEDWPSVYAEIVGGER